MNRGNSGFWLTEVNSDIFVVTKAEKVALLLSDIAFSLFHSK